MRLETRLTDIVYFGCAALMEEAVGPCIVNCETDGQCSDGNDCTNDFCEAGVCAHSRRANGESYLYEIGDDEFLLGQCILGRCRGAVTPPPVVDP